MVHLAKDVETGVVVVVKTPLNQNDEIENWLFEATIHKRLKHPFILKINDIYLYGGRIALIMDYAENGDLASYIGKCLTANKDIEVATIYRMMAQLIISLGYAHSCGIAHRDIKPKNIFLNTFRGHRIV